jgi:hypothetical protein
MAKSQELVLNANKLSGVCGRLMCCLSYEYSDSDTTVGNVLEGEAAVLSGADVEEGSAVGEEHSLAAVEDRTAERAGRSRGHGREHKTHYVPPGEAEKQKSPAKQGRIETLEGASDRVVRNAPKEAGQSEKTETVAGESEGDKKKFHKRKRHGRRFRK